MQDIPPLGPHPKVRRRVGEARHANAVDDDAVPAARQGTPKRRPRAEPMGARRITFSTVQKAHCRFAVNRRGEKRKKRFFKKHHSPSHRCIGTAGAVSPPKVAERNHPRH